MHPTTDNLHLNPHVSANSTSDAIRDLRAQIQLQRRPSRLESRETATGRSNFKSDFSPTKRRRTGTFGSASGNRPVVDVPANQPRVHFTKSLISALTPAKRAFSWRQVSEWTTTNKKGIKMESQHSSENDHSLSPRTGVETKPARRWRPIALSPMIKAQPDETWKRRSLPVLPTSSSPQLSKRDGHIDRRRTIMLRQSTLQHPVVDALPEGSLASAAGRDPHIGSFEQSPEKQEDVNKSQEGSTEKKKKKKNRKKLIKKNPAGVKQEDTEAENIETQPKTGQLTLRADETESQPINDYACFEDSPKIESEDELQKGLAAMQITQETGTRRSERLRDLKLKRQQAREQRLRDIAKAQKAIETSREAIARFNKSSEPVLSKVDLNWVRRLTSEMDDADSPSTTLATSLNSIELNRHAFGTCLPRRNDDPSGWLNDEIILSYLEHIVNYGKGLTKDSKRPKQAKDDAPRYAAFNPQFWTTMSQRGPSAVLRWANRIGLKGDRLLEAMLVFIPINAGLHWTLLALYPQRRYAVHYDSMGNHGQKHEKQLRGYLEAHLKDLYKGDEWTYEVADSPQQNNTSDCGVFTITTARMLALGWDPKASYSSRDIDMQRRRILCELMNGGFTGEFLPRDALAGSMAVLDNALKRRKELEEELANMED